MSLIVTRVIILCSAKRGKCWQTVMYPDFRNGKIGVLELKAYGGFSDSFPVSTMKIYSILGIFSTRYVLSWSRLTEACCGSITYVAQLEPEPRCLWLKSPHAQSLPHRKGYCPQENIPLCCLLWPSVMVYAPVLVIYSSICARCVYFLFTYIFFEPGILYSSLYWSDCLELNNDLFTAKCSSPFSLNFSWPRLHLTCPMILSLKLLSCVSE